MLQDATFSFNLPRVNPKTNTSVVPYIHHTIIDPTQTFLLAPDLSGDLIHVFSLTSSYTLERLPAQTDISVPKGHGPRHGVFYQPGNGSNTTYLYVVMETANMVHGYQVKYNADKTLNFTMIQDLQLPVPASAPAAEIRLTPDNKYLIVSSRSDNNFTIPNPDPKNSAQIPSDSLFNFLISPSNGAISLVQRFLAGSLFPRQFEINKAGNMLAVALNGDNRLTVVGRDVAGGNMTRILASLDIDAGGRGLGMVTCAVWDEDDQNYASKGNSSVATSASTAKSSQTLVLPTPTNKPVNSTGGDLPDEELISALSASLASEKPNAAGATLSAIEIMESMISLGASATALERIMASLTHSNSSATSITTRILESIMALSSSMAIFSDDLESIITKSPASTTQAGGSKPAAGVVPSTAPPTALASTTSGSAASTTGAVTTPTTFQAGMIEKCTKFHLVASEDTCSSIATVAGISLSDLYTWNPAVGTSCAILFEKNNVCIGVGS